jgi:purine-nucleoside phosphorylase
MPNVNNEVARYNVLTIGLVLNALNFTEVSRSERSIVYTNKVNVVIRINSSGAYGEQQLKDVVIKKLDIPFIDFKKLYEGYRPSTNSHT